MQVFRLKVGDGPRTVTIGDDVVIVLTKVSENRVTMAIEAPKNLRVRDDVPRPRRDCDGG